MRKAILAIAVVAILFSATIPAMGFLQSKRMPKTTVNDDEDEPYYGVRIIWGDGDNERKFMSYSQFGLVDEDGNTIEYDPSDDPDGADYDAVVKWFDDNYDPKFKALQEGWKTDPDADDPDPAASGADIDNLLDLPELPIGNFSICDIINTLFGWVDEWNGGYDPAEAIDLFVNWLFDRSSRRANTIISMGIGQASNVGPWQLFLHRMRYTAGELGEGWYILPIDVNYPRFGFTAFAQWPYNLRCEMGVNWGKNAHVTPMWFKGVYINIGKLFDKEERFDGDGIIIIFGQTAFNAIDPPF
jgi:hypothetical protein